ncbi:MAG: recombinase family protein [Peptostreptococcaceae bacterium]|nr:recombinase family protein [Peptostreptococcaceae bacterium]
MGKNINVKSPIRVAVYCRVATNHLNQQNSIEAQKKPLIKLINSNPNWELVAIYSDQGLSGISTKESVQFNKMIVDANVNKKIDLIITKDASRFSRNTLDMLTHIRELNSNNVNVFFVNEKVSAMETYGGFRLKLMASFAQAERRIKTMRSLNQ